MYNFVTKNEDDTKLLAYNLASILKKGDVIVLTGELGSRKNKIYRTAF